MSVPTRRLPPQPNLHHLRKQAKDLLHLYRSSDPGALAEVNQFEWAADPAKFELNDAQRVLARAYGFESWPKLKAFVDGANVKRLADAVETGDLSQVRVLLNMRPELIGMDLSGGDERQAIHLAVLRRDVAMAKLLMEAGADARKGVYPHRKATSALTIARDRGYDEIVGVIEEEERRRREENSCPNAKISPEQEQVAEAVRRGDTAEAMRLLDEDKSLIQACDQHGATPLHIAAQSWDTDLVEWLLRWRANVRKEDVFGLTPLDRAAIAAGPQNGGAQRFPAIARVLLARGAPLTIWAAVALGKTEQVRQLAVANPGSLREIGPSGGLLTVAVRHGQLETARLLLDLGADVDERILLKELEEPTVSWGGPLWHAALAGDREMAELLLDRGADPNSNVYASGWPIRNAWGHKDESVKQLLLERRARLPPQMIGELHQVDAARRLLAEDSSEQLAAELLESAADSGCSEIVEMALQRLDWPRSHSKWHWYLIQPVRGIGSLASHDGHFECMRLLLRHGIDANIASLGETVLHFTAAWHGDVSEAERARFAELLLDHGARLDIRDHLLQSTPLGWACRWGREEMVKLFLNRGADPLESEAEPWARPSAWAQQARHHEVLRLLREHAGE